MSRNTFVYSSLSLVSITLAVLLLHAAFTALIPDQTAARISTALVAAFTFGALSAILAVHFGAQLRAGAREPSKAMPPRRIYFPPTAEPPPTSAPSTSSHEMETAYHPIVLVQNGVARSLDDPKGNRRSDVIDWAEFDPQQGRHVSHAIDLATLRRFARLHTPSRSEWSGKATTYTEALACFRHYAWVQPTGAGKGVAWVHPYTKLQRRLAYLGDTAALLSPG